MYGIVQAYIFGSLYKTLNHSHMHSATCQPKIGLHQHQHLHYLVKPIGAVSLMKLGSNHQH